MILNDSVKRLFSDLVTKNNMKFFLIIFDGEDRQTNRQIFQIYSFYFQYELKSRRFTLFNKVIAQSFLIFENFQF
jgi:hypothetical protein